MLTIQKVYDNYATTQGYTNWQSLVNVLASTSNHLELAKHTMEVAKDVQKAFAANIEENVTFDLVELDRYDNETIVDKHDNQGFPLNCYDEETMSDLVVKVDMESINASMLC